MFLKGKAASSSGFFYDAAFESFQDSDLDPRMRTAGLSALNQGFQTLKAGNPEGFRVCPQGRLPTEKTPKLQFKEF